MKIKLPKLTQNTLIGILAVLFVLSFFISEDSDVGKVLKSATSILNQDLGLSEDTTTTSNKDKEIETDSNNEENKQHLVEGTVTKVVDGDTIYVVVNGEERSVRLIGIDSPETKHPTIDPECYGAEASAYLTTLVVNKVIKLEIDKTAEDRYDRLLRHIWLGDLNVNNDLVRKGYAFSVEYKPDIRYQDEYDASEQYAKDNNLGLWSDKCNN